MQSDDKFSVYLTGATSKIGKFLVEKLVLNPKVDKIYCLTRNPPRVAAPFQSLNHQKIRFLKMDLLQVHQSNLPDFGHRDVFVHLAALTHSNQAEQYNLVNFEGTRALAKLVLDKGCKKFAFVSSQTSGTDAGAYGLSKWNAEEFLLTQQWQNLLIIRPSEVLTENGTEGIDKFIALARKLHVLPWLIHSSELIFSPISVDLLIDHLAYEITAVSGRSVNQDYVIQSVKGPDLSSKELSLCLAKKYWALPIPIFLSLIGFLQMILKKVGLHIIAEDQIKRVTGTRDQIPNQAAKLSPVRIAFSFENYLK